ncbi:penicillin acylase family protein [Kutzneria viridogrisea]|uniref:Acyl-homoserine-lactone acylase n=1 Tax=Kutzneria viridogrisea TaxID=47990 RepID=A0ABR6BKC4_9PSEU|nr:acyl-homoserine-lactone acylase [Kutzneria viridogrisea]
MRFVRALLAALTAVTLTAGTAAATEDGSRGVLIQRTEYGIPHITASGFTDLGHGYGYAFAQDNLCTLADTVLTVTGERSRYLGPDADAGDQLSGPLSNLDSDVFHRSVNDTGQPRRAMAQPAPLGPTRQVRQMISGYVAGVNEYLARTGVANLPDPTCRAKPWVRPITTDDLDLLLYYLNQFGGLDRFQRQIANSAPAAPGTVPHSAVNPDLGSNGIAVGREGSQGGYGVLLANPHFPWLGANRFYQVQLTIPGVLNVSGASLYGLPFVAIGHTEHLAWTHTVSTAQRFTLYELHLVPGDPTSYLVDGKAERMAARTVRVPLPGGGTAERTVHDSRYGPVLGGNWTADTAYAVRGASVDNGRSSNEWLAMAQSDSVAQLRAAQDRYQGIPFVNTMASDSTGTAYYADASVVPHVTDAQAARCVNSPYGKQVYPALTVLDGSTSDCQWGSDPDAVTSGIFGPRANPSLQRADYVTNSNDSFWLTNPAAPITGLPKIYGLSGTQRSPRTRLGLDTIARRLNGTDGLGAPGFSGPTTWQALMGNRNLSGELARDSVVSLCRGQSTLTASNGEQVDVREACTALANWDLRGNLDSRGAVLWRQFWLPATRATDLWTVPFDPAHPATTPNTLNTASPAMRTALADAVQRMRALHVPLDAPLSAAQYTAAAGDDKAVPGCGNGEGCYDITSSLGGAQLLGADGRFPAISFGSSFVMSVELRQSGPVARTLLTYSQSANPDSPHHGDQTDLFGRGLWVQEKFSQAQIVADPHLSTTILRTRG